MDLTESERVILSNQFKILEQLYPDEAEEYERNRKIVNNGYAYDYGEISPLIDEELSIRDCEEVLSILSMHSTLLRSAQALTDDPKIPVSFHGFDGNNETEQMAYTRFYIEELNKFTELKDIAQSEDYNSHMPTLDRYRLMLEEWDRCADKHNLTREEINRILDVDYHNSISSLSFIK